MKGNPEERAARLAEYILETGATVRGAAMQFGISKSTVHTDVTKQNGSFGVFNNRSNSIFDWRCFSGEMLYIQFQDGMCCIHS